MEFDDVVQLLDVSLGGCFFLERGHLHLVASTNILVEACPAPHPNLAPRHGLEKSEVVDESSLLSLWCLGGGITPPPLSLL
jgi:hypothetical protein